MHPVTNAEKELLHDLVAKTNYVLLYEDFDLQNFALETVPLEVLSTNASNKAAALKTSGECKIGEDDLLIMELLQWFKFSFFSWVDAPKCDTCGKDTQKTGMVSPLPDEQRWNAQRVEIYFCTQCQRQTRFPRYNHPGKLLETRKGRCGEWANCFTFLCRSLGYDARLVIEWGDHVWTEVYSQSQKRWVHCDACENAYDMPLVYEMGWKKKISYIIAISKDEVQDVTWRYCTNFQEVLQQRTLYREEFLLSAILSLTNSLQRNYTAERRGYLLKLKLIELVTFLTPPAATEDYGGRSSGSKAWRELRGEYHPQKDKKSFVFLLDEEEIKKKYFHLKYSCAEDKYVRDSANSPESKKWDSWIFREENVFRKTEQDWKMAYLCREEGCSTGLLSWKFDFSDSGLVVKNLKLNVQSETFENGDVTWIIHSAETDIPIEAPGPVTIEDLQGSPEFSLTAHLTGGSGPVAWQHAQLFRQSLDSKDFPFDIELHLMNKPPNPSS